MEELCINLLLTVFCSLCFLPDAFYILRELYRKIKEEKEKKEREK